MAGQPEIQPRKRGRPTAEERRARESEILSNVLCVFLLCGYGASTVDELAAAAQVTKRTLYTYYGDKAGLFAAMVTDLAATVSLDATSDDDTLEVLAARIVSRVHSDELVGLHRLVIAESARFPELALILHSSGDARHIARLAEHIRAECGPASEPLAEPLFSLLLGEKHRRRLLGIDPAPTPAEAAGHARAALAQLGLRLARTDLDRVRAYVSDKPGYLRHVTLACYVLGQPGPAKETGTSATKRSGPRRSANYHHGAAAVGDAVLADRAEEHARELSVAVTPDDDEIGGLREGLEHRCRMPLDN
jgi:TetR/AcrR family transcriptional repressor of mexJK operon